MHLVIDLYNGFYVDCFLRFLIFEKGMSKKMSQVFADS